MRGELEYYVNDEGLQISTLGNSLFKRYQQLRNINIKLKDNEYPGDYLIELAENISKEDEDKWLNVEKNLRDKFFKQYAVSNILNSIDKDLKKINVNFDKFSYESQIIKKNNIQKVLKILNNKNLLYEGILEKPKGEDLHDWEPRKQLLYKASNFEDDNDRVLQKANGEWTYFANDTAYHYDKISRNYNKLINIWGSDHIGYVNRLKSIVDVISDKSNYLDIKICQIVRLLINDKILKMSKREGNFISLKEIFLKVGKDPLRYYMISKKNETPIDFDMNKVIEKNKDNQVFYCQYAYARASSVINKAIEKEYFKNFKSKNSDFDIKNISEYEKEIILKIISWPHLLLQSAISMQPHKIINYIEDLSSHFHSFWNRGKDEKSLRIIDFENKKKTITKLVWIESMRIVLKNAFQIIDIESNEKM